MQEINETFGTYLVRLEEAIKAAGGLDGLKDNSGLILGRNAKIPILIDGEDEDITKTPVMFPLYQKNMFYIVDVPRGKTIDKHQHDEDIFRILLSGDMKVNGINIKVGEWFVVPAETPYDVKTENGYQSFAAYTSNCRTRRTLTGKHLVKE